MKVREVGEAVSHAVGNIELKDLAPSQHTVDQVSEYCNMWLNIFCFLGVVLLLVIAFFAIRGVYRKIKDIIATVKARRINRAGRA
jgi:hypothetical protein